MKNGWVCWCLDSVDRDIAKVQKAWRSLLCPAQYLMIDKDAKNELGGLVLGATPYGVMIWKIGKAHLWTYSVLGLRALGLARKWRTHLGT